MQTNFEVIDQFFAERGAQDSFYEPYKYYDPFVEGSYR